MPATATRRRRPVPPVAGQFELMLGRPPAADGQLDIVAAANEALDVPPGCCCGFPDGICRC